MVGGGCGGGDGRNAWPGALEHYHRKPIENIQKASKSYHRTIEETPNYQRIPNISNQRRRTRTARSQEAETSEVNRLDQELLSFAKLEFQARYGQPCEEAP